MIQNFNDKHRKVMIKPLVEFLLSFILITELVIIPSCPSNNNIPRILSSWPAWILTGFLHYCA